ncbi:MAG: hypothetical protein ACYTFO_07480, partial [Planctomycetota bacterium]
MHTQRRIMAIAAACLSVWIGWAAQADVHLPEDNETGFNWHATDGAGSRWDISNIGMVVDGSDDAFDGGMRLIVAQSAFGNSQPARASAEGNEIEIGPYARQGLNVYRRIYIDPELGYCRWIEIFENSSDQDQSFMVRTMTNIGGADCQITT